MGYNKFEDLENLELSREGVICIITLTAIAVAYLFIYISYTSS